MDALEVRVSSTVYERALGAGLSDSEASLKAAAAVEGWRARSGTDTRTAQKFGQDWRF
ncbi:MAG: hypothetical protein OXB99_02770 [Acidimicrobiaceae bacterium]|nr:hypothetical protein [Acidimicrobiaceae bacterium]